MGASAVVTTTSYVWAGDTLVASIVGNGTASSTYYTHPDHLGSTNVTTNASGTAVSVTGYYPYGSERISSGTSPIERTYIGQYFDDTAAMSYLINRYYQNDKGRFISQDPVHLAIGSPGAEQLANRKLQQILSDPQLLNSYSYARNNPITNSDPTGLISKAQIELLYNLLEIYSDYQLGKTTLDYASDSPGESVRERASDQAQFYLDSSLFGVGVAASVGFGLVGIGAALNAGGITLSVYDSYCTNHTCRNFAKPGDPTLKEIFEKTKPGSGSSSRAPVVAPNNSSNPSGNNQTQPQQSTSQGGGSNQKSFSAQIASIQAQINAIRTQINMLARQRAGSR